MYHSTSTRKSFWDCPAGKSSWRTTARPCAISVVPESASLATTSWATESGGPLKANSPAVRPVPSSFDYDLVKDAPPTEGVVVDAETMWRNYTRFITTVLPVAEAAGVTLSLHPDDPPVPTLGGIARIFNSLDGFKRAMEEIAPSSHHKLTFCMGTWAELGTGPMFEAMEHFGRAGRIAYVHFRNVRGVIPRFTESFIDDGDVDCAEAIRRLSAMNFDGFLIDDHVPHMSDDTIYMHRGRAFAIGYMRGLIHAINGRTHAGG